MTLAMIQLLFPSIRDNIIKGIKAVMLNINRPLRMVLINDNERPDHTYKLLNVHKSRGSLVIWTTTSSGGRGFRNQADTSEFFPNLCTKFILEFPMSFSVM